MIESVYRFTIEEAGEAGVVAFPFGAELESEPEFAMTSAAQEVRYSGAPWAANFGRGNAGHGIRVAWLEELANHSQVRVKGAVIGELLKVGKSVSLLVDVKDGGQFRFHDVVIEEARPFYPIRNGFKLGVSLSANAGRIDVIDDAGLGL